MLRARVFIVASVLACSIGLVQSASAASRTPFTSVLTLGQPSQPQRSWVSGPIRHVRGEPNAGTLAGDLVGSATITNNYNLRPPTGDGANWGTFEITANGTTWEGTYRGILRGGVNDGTFIGQGDDGSLIKGSFTWIGQFVFRLDGVTLDPHG